MIAVHLKHNLFQLVILLYIAYLVSIQLWNDIAEKNILPTNDLYLCLLYIECIRHTPQLILKNYSKKVIFQNNTLTYISLNVSHCLDSFPYDTIRRCHQKINIIYSLIEEYFLNCESVLKKKTEIKHYQPKKIRTFKQNFEVLVWYKPFQVSFLLI